MSTGVGYGGCRRRLYRDRENGLFLGVCAGVADFFGFSTLAVRVIAVLALICAFVPTALVYLIAGVLLRDKPLSYRGRRGEQDFWRSGSGGSENWS